MSAGVALSHHVADFVDAAVAGRRDRAWDVVDSLRAVGVDDARIVHGLLGPAQRRVGQQWEAGILTIADEHIATGVTEHCLDHLLAQSSKASLHGRVLVTGPAEQWHTMPARMVAGAWRTVGLDAVVVAPSLPADDLYDLAVRDSASVAGVSCVMPAHLVHAWTAINALRTAGLRVVVGGRAFDSYPHLAPALGADAYADDAFSAADLVIEWAQEAKSEREPRDLVGWSAVRRTMVDYETIVSGASVVMAARDHLGIDARAGRRHVALLLEAAMSARLVGEPQLIADHLTWLQGRALVEGYDLTAVWGMVDSLLRAMPSYTEGVREELRVAMQAQ